MFLFNKGKRSFLVPRKDVVNPAPPENEGMTKKAYIRPNEITEVSDECGQQLLKKYRSELMKVGSKDGAPAKVAPKRKRKEKIEA